MHSIAARDMQQDANKDQISKRVERGAILDNEDQ